MRLINADILIEDLNRQLSEVDCTDKNRLLISMIITSVQGTIKRQPTAYDVDKVVEQLEEQQNYCKENAYKSETLTMLYHEYNKIIDIVKQNLVN